MFVAASAAFGFLHAAPGNPILAMADAASIPLDQREAWLAQGGFDKPVLTQYRHWMSQVARAQLGDSYSQHRPVREVILDAVPATLLLMSLALVSSLLFGAAIGAWQGAHSGSRADKSLSFVSLLLYSIPEFWLALVLMLLFVSTLHWLPATGIKDVVMHNSMSFGGQLMDRLRHVLQPWAALTLVGTAIFARYQRAAFRALHAKGFVRTARAKGLSESAVRLQIWRNALPPMITLAGLFLPTLLTGAVFVEKIFGWPGLGSVMLDAINKRDYQLVSGCVIVGSAMTTLGSLLADVVRTTVDPRLRSS